MHLESLIFELPVYDKKKGKKRKRKKKDDPRKKDNQILEYEEF